MRLEWMNTLLPGIAALAHCTQGTKKHTEGDVARHTWLVFQHFTRLAPERLGRPAEFIEQLAILIHDCRKPETRTELEPGAVSFPGHEELAVADAVRVAPLLELSTDEAEKLCYLVATHGEAHRWSQLSTPERKALCVSPWAPSMALLQEADALACLYPDGSHGPVYWNELCVAIEKFRGEAGRQ